VADLLLKTISIFLNSKSNPPLSLKISVKIIPPFQRYRPEKLIIMPASETTN
jgi:hypothetical protein